MGAVVSARLTDKVAVVTGAGSGLGRAMATLFGAEGAAVVCQDLVEEAAAGTARDITGAGGRAVVWACDVTDRPAIDELFVTAAATFGLCDVLVNCAGVAATPGDGAGEDGVQLVLMSDEAWSRMVDIHLTGAFYCTRAMVRGLLEAGRPGSIVCISSVAATSGFGPIHYAAAKGGLLGFVRSAARVLGPHHIRANAVAPGLIETPMTTVLPRERTEALRLMSPLGRLGQPADIANAALYLASDESDFVTGQVLSPNGGLVIT